MPPSKRPGRTAPHADERFPAVYTAVMCAACAIAAAAGANGARAWLQAHHLTWLTPSRLRTLTITLFVAALLVSTVTFSGTGKPDGSSQSNVSHTR